MSGLDLYLELKEKTALLDKAISLLPQRGRTFAQAEHDYKVELAKKILTERENGIPVTIISDICRGSSVIAKKRFERDVAEVMYDSAKEAINSYKLQLRLLEGQIQRDWGQSERIC